MTTDRNERSADDLLELATVALRDAAIADGPPPALLASTAESLQATSHPPFCTIANHRKNSLSRVIRVSSLVAAVVLVATVASWFLMLDQTASVSLAGMNNRMAQAHSVRFQATTSTDGGAVVTYACVALAEGLWRTDYGHSLGNSYNVTDIHRGKSMLVSPDSREARITVGLNPRSRDNLYDWIRSLPNDAVRRLPEKVVDGHTVVGFVAVQDEVSLRLEWTVWVDPQTYLPVKLEYKGWSADGHSFTGTMRDIVFDGHVDPVRLRMQPPDGFTVTTAGLAGLPQPPKEKELAAPEVKPGIGLGPAQFGMSSDEVIRLLGQPDIIADNGKRLDYRSRGFTLRVSLVRGWNSVDCYGQEVQEVIVRDFAGQTKEGIGLGSSLSDLTAAFGTPEEVKNRKEVPSTICALYPARGLEFTLFHDRVVRFSMGSTTAVPKSTVRVEFHPAQNEPGEGLTETSVVGSARKVYLHKSPCVTAADIAEASAAVDEHGQPVIDLAFTPKGAEKMKMLTSKSLNRLLAVLVDDKLICAPRIIVPISRSARITGQFTQEEVARIVRGINGRAPENDALPKEAQTVEPHTKPQSDVNTTDGEDPQHMQSMHNLKQLGLAMHKYYDVHKRYPPAASYDASGKPLLSCASIFYPSWARKISTISFIWMSPGTANTISRSSHSS